VPVGSFLGLGVAANMKTDRPAAESAGTKDGDAGVRGVFSQMEDFIIVGKSTSTNLTASSLITNVMFLSVIAVYCFGVNWLFQTWFPDGVVKGIASGALLQEWEGFLNGVVFGIALPLILLTPAILALGWYVKSIVATWLCVSVGLATSILGASMAQPGKHEFTISSELVLGLAVYAVPTVVLTILLKLLIATILEHR
jgi:hypothetical protein